MTTAVLDPDATDGPLRTDWLTLDALLRRQPGDVPPDTTIDSRPEEAGR